MATRLPLLMWIALACLACADGGDNTSRLNDASVDEPDQGSAGAGGLPGVGGMGGAGGAGVGGAGGSGGVGGMGGPGGMGGMGGEGGMGGLGGMGGGQPDMGLPPGPDAEPPPPVSQDCVYDSDTVGEPQQEFDVGPDSDERLRFVVRGLPDPALIESAQLTFDSFDSDHPGEEGIIQINDQGAYDVPARLEWDNQPGTGVVDITGATIEGRNRVAFGPGPLPRSFYGISNVRIAARARIEACPEGPPPPPPPPAEAQVREIRYPAAEYTNRRTWVVGCENNPLRAYAFTARGDEHVPTDCEGLYRAGGNRQGDAIFRFDDVVEAEYEIIVGSRHTENRSPNGALILVNGESRRISQRSDRGFTEDVWGQRRLSGQVEVIMRAEGNSDSIINVRLVPVGG